MSRWVERFLHLSHGERSTHEVRRVRGYTLSRGTCPLTPTLSPKGRGGRLCLWRSLSFIAVVFVALAAPAVAQSPKPQNYGIGTPATAEQIAGWDIDVRPDGQGLPPGKGSVRDGEKIYLERCAACHGEFGESAGRWPQLAQGKGTLATHDPVKTVGSYFPYVASFFDYIRRSMPFGDAQSLSNDELYAVTAFILNLNDIVDDKFVLSKETWSKVKMPNEGGFYDDDRNVTEKAFWNKNPCMKDCRPPVKITGHASVIDVTPDDKTIRKGGVE